MVKTILTKNLTTFKIKNGKRFFFTGSMLKNRKANKNEIIVAHKGKRGVFFAVYKK